MTSGANPPPIVSDAYRIEQDMTLGLVRVTVTGLWSEADLATYLTDLGPIVDGLRKRHRVAKVLVDRRDSPVQSRRIHERVCDVVPSLLREQDVLAIIVDSALSRMQARRALELRHGETFYCEADALAWLARF